MKQNYQKKNKVVTGKTPFFVIGPFCTPHSICLNIGFWQGSFVWKCYIFNLKGCLHESRNKIHSNQNFVPLREKFCPHYFSLRAKWNEILFWEWSEWNDSSTNVNKLKWDIETSMLEATMYTFIEEVFR